MATIITINRKLVKKFIKQIILKSYRVKCNQTIWKECICGLLSKFWLKTSGCHLTWPSLLQKIENYCQKTYFKIREKASCHQTLWKWCIYDPLSDLWLVTLVAYEKWLLSLLKIDYFFYNSLNIVKSQCSYQTIKEQCIYNSLSDHEWWPRLPSNMAVVASQTWKLVKKICKK